jgi:hypothetical protein
MSGPTIRGNLIGNVTGDVTGNLTGTVTGTASGCLALDHSNYMTDQIGFTQLNAVSAAVEGVQIDPFIYDTTAGAESIGITIDTLTAGVWASPVEVSDRVYLNTTDSFPLYIEWSDNGAASGPNVTINRISTSPAAADLIGLIRFTGRDSGGNFTNYVSLTARIDDPTDTSEDGSLLIGTRQAGGTGPTTEMTIGAGTQLGAPTGGAKGAGTLNAAGTIYVNNVAVQTVDAELTALAGLTSAADKLPYFTGAGTADVTTLTSFARTVLDDTDAATARATLGVAIGTNVQAYDATLTALAGTLTAANKIPYATAADTASELTLDTDGTLAANSDVTLATQKAVKTYVDAHAGGGSWTQSGAVATTSGTSVTILAAGTIPATAKKVVIMFKDISHNAANTAACVVMTNGGGDISSGYNVYGRIGGSGSIKPTNHIPLSSSETEATWDAADTWAGVLELTRMDPSNAVWSVIGMGNSSQTTNQETNIYGYLNFAADFTGIKLTTNAGTATFDAGSVYVAYFD